MSQTFWSGTAEAGETETGVFDSPNETDSARYLLLVSAWTGQRIPFSRNDSQTALSIVIGSVKWLPVLGNLWWLAVIEWWLEHQRPKLTTGLDNFLRARLWSGAPPNLPPQEMSPRTFQKGGIIPEKTVIIEQKHLKKEGHGEKERKKERNVLPWNNADGILILNNIQCKKPAHWNNVRLSTDIPNWVSLKKTK